MLRLKEALGALGPLGFRVSLRLLLQPGGLGEAAAVLAWLQSILKEQVQVIPHSQDMGYTEMISGSHLLGVPHETAGYQGEQLS